MNTRRLTPLIGAKFILRDGADGGGGGAGYSAEGADGAAPAPSNDRTSKLERKVDRLADALGSFVDGQQKSERSREAQDLEAQIQQFERVAAAKVDDAENALADAYEEGDGRTIAAAQRKLSEATAERERISVAARQAREEIKSSEHRDGGSRGEGAEPKLDTTNLDNWKSTNASWYGIDKEMTKYAHELDQQIRGNGVLKQGSKEYFDAIDRQMKQRFPDQFSGSPPTGGYGGGAGGGDAGRVRSRIPQSVADGFRRMGIDVDNPDTAKRMVKHRETAVRKGFLSEQPATGRVLTR